MKDKMMYGNKPFKKVIAQEVEQVYPQVITKHADFIPNVYCLTDSVVKIADGYRLIFLRPHQLTADAKKLRLMAKQDGSMHTYQIIAISSPNEVIIAADKPIDGNVFVYGQQVLDFRTVDYEALTTLTISATQELDRKVSKLEKALATANENIRILAAAMRRQNKPVTHNRLTAAKLNRKQLTGKQAHVRS
jgi:hypothetical protein